MCKKNFIRHLNRLYHVTLKENQGSILSKGLVPQSKNNDLYGAMCGLTRPRVFLCTKQHLQDFIKMTTRLPLSEPPSDVAVFSVSAEFVARLDLDVDSTYSCVSHLLDQGTPFITIVEKCGAIVCFGAIPPTEIELVENLRALISANNWSR